MKRFFIVPDKKMPTVESCGSLGGVHHWIQLADGHCFLSLEGSEPTPKGWIELPHVLETTPLGKKHAKLASIGVKPHHRTIDAVLLAHKIHPLFHP